MTQFDQSKWRKNQLLNELGLNESVADQAAKAIDDAISSVDESLSYKDFALAVAAILKSEYGSHNFAPFMEVLHGALGMNESLNEGELEDEAKKLDLTLTKKDGKIEVGGDSIDKDDFEKIAKKLGYKVDREVEKGEYDRLYISK